MKPNTPGYSVNQYEEEKTALPSLVFSRGIQLIARAVVEVCQTGHVSKQTRSSEQASQGCVKSDTASWVGEWFSGRESGLWSGKRAPRPPSLRGSHLTHLLTMRNQVGTWTSRHEYDLGSPCRVQPCASEPGSTLTHLQIRSATRARRLGLATHPGGGGVGEGMGPPPPVIFCSKTPYPYVGACRSANPTSH